jgi:phosphate transport system protein
MPTETPLDQELSSLHGLIGEMASLVDEQFADAMNALLSEDAQLADEVVARDDVIDQLEMKIDDQCERILALHAPVATDLRMLIMAVKINTDFERIGDHCRNLARNTPSLIDGPDLLTETHIPEMADMSRAMLREVEVAFWERDRLKARKVIARDLQVNRLHAKNVDRLVHMIGEDDGAHAKAIANLLTASKALERISDHTKNIAQSIVFMVEGTDIRHSGLQASNAPKTSSDGTP